MEGVCVNGSVEIGHSIFLEAGDTGSKWIQIALSAVFGTDGHIIMWNIREGTWVAWNVLLRQLHGPNERAIKIIQRTYDRAAILPHEVEAALEHIGGFVGILTDEEADVIFGALPFQNGPTTRMFVLRNGNERGRDGGIGAVAF